jgi:hypothetical protein
MKDRYQRTGFSVHINGFMSMDVSVSTRKLLMDIYIKNKFGAQFNSLIWNPASGWKKVFTCIQTLEK